MAYQFSKLTFGTYIFKILKQLHPDTGITSNAKLTINNLLIDILQKIVKYAEVLLIVTNKNTLTSREIQSSIRSILPKKLAQDAVNEGTRALTRFDASISGKSKTIKGGKNTSVGSRAGLTLSPSRVVRLIRVLDQKNRIGVGSKIFAAAVLEHLAAVILEMAGNSSRDHKRVRITNRDIALVIKNDEDLNNIFGKSNVVLGGGVVPYIHEQLLKGKKEKESRSQPPASQVF